MLSETKIRCFLCLADTLSFTEAAGRLFMTQQAVSKYDVILNGDGSSADIVSRGVARDHSYQKFDACVIGNTACSGHTECDSIIMDKAKISSIPEIVATHADAEIIHEAAIGRINNDQLIKLQTFGMTELEAESVIIEGFLK